MAAIFKLRRGTSIPSLVESEPFYKTDSDSFHIGDGSTYITLVKIGVNTGSIEFTGDISASNLTLSGDATVNGNITFGGSLITLGDSDEDDIVFVGEMSSSLIPNNDAAFDIGSSLKRYKNLHVVSASIENVSFGGTRILSSSLGDFQDFDTFSGSVDTRFTVINSFTSSEEDKNIILQNVTSSFDSRLTNIESFSSSQETKDTTLETVTSSFDDRISQLETDSGSQDSRLDNIETTTASFDDRISQLESDTGSQDSRLDNLETYTSSNDTNITELFATASDHESRVDVLEGSFSSSVDSRLDYLEGSFSSSVDGRLDQLETHSGSTDSRLDNIENVTGSYATTGSNLFIGNQTITGSIEGSGSVRFRGIPWPETGSEHHLFKTDPYTLNISSGDRNYGYLGVALDHYEEDPDYFHNSLIMYTYDDHSNPSYGAELNVGPLRTHMQVLASGSGNLGNISIQDVEDGTTRGLFYADDIQLGVYTGSTVSIGNAITTTTIDGTLVSIKAPVSSSTHISASAFVGDGEQLSNVTASYVHYTNIDGKPTLVSQSAQINVNDTQNFTAFSTSVDSRLDSIEGDFSTSVDSQLQDIHNYTSSLRNAIDVNGNDLTVYGDLTVQGETTTLNTSNLLVEDKLIELASGSTTSAEADGAGLYISGANVFLTWNDTYDVFQTNRKFSSSLGLVGDGSEITNIQHGNIVFGGSDIVSGSTQVTGALDLRYLEILGDGVVSESHQIDLTQTTNYESGIKQRLDAEGVVSSSVDTSTISFSIESGIISASAIGGIVSQSAQVVLQDADKTGFTGAASISTVGTITSGVWNGTAINQAYLDDTILNNSLNDYTASNDISGSDQDARLDNIETATASLESRLDNTEAFTSSYFTDSASFDSRLDVEEEKSTTLETVTSSFDDRLGQLETTTSSLDSRLDYLEGDLSTSVDDRLNLLSAVSHSHSNKAFIDTVDQDLASTDEPSFAGLSLTSLLPQASGSIEFNALFLSSSNEFTYRTLGDAILYSVTSSDEVELVSGSISYGSDNLLTAGAVKKYVDWRTEEILDAIGAADITAVTPTPGGSLIGGGTSGHVSLSLDSGSDSFKLSVYEVFGTGVLSSSNETFAEFSSSVASDFAGLSTDYNDLQNIPSGIISSSEQIDDLFNIDGLVSSSEQIVDVLSSLNTYTGSNDLNITELFATASDHTGSITELFSSASDHEDRIDTLEGASVESPLTFNDTAQVDLIRTGDVITANLKGGVISGSQQVVDAVLNQATDFGTGRVSGDNFGDVAGTSTFTGSFVGDGTQLSGVTSYTDADTLDYINSLEVISGSAQVVNSLLNQDVDFGTGDITASYISASNGITASSLELEVGDANIFIGRFAANTLDTGVSVQNVAIGKYTLGGDTAGGVENVDASVAIGYNALFSVTSGATSNVGIGYQTLFDNTSGNNNTALGAFAGNNIDIGYRNTVLGASAGSSITSGFGNTLVGYVANVQNAGDSNSIVIGSGSLGNGSNTVVIGNDAIVSTTLKGEVTSSGHLVPSQHETYDLGSPTQRWRDLYLSGSTIDLGGTLITKNADGDIQFINSGTQEAQSAIVSYASITDLPTLVSGSDQILGGTNIVSQSTDSNNIDFTITNGNITANLKGGVVSGSSQVTQSLDSRYLNVAGGDSVSGNTTFQDITVNGTGSFAYIQSTTGSAKVIGDAFVIVNSDTPTQRYAGLSVYDSGSTQASASFFFDSQLNDWNYEYSGSGGIDYAVTIFGPEYSTKGNPTYLTDNTIPKALDNHHIVDSNISDNGSVITLGSDVVINGTVVSSGTTIVSQSEQIDITSTTGTLDISARTNLAVSDTAQVDMILTNDTISANLKGGVVSGSSQVNFTQLSGISPNIISASSDTAQVDMIIAGGNISANLKGGVVSGSTQVSVGGDLSGTAASATVGKIQGVAITSGEATQLANIDSTTISSTQWGYLGALNQGLTTTSTVQFGKVGVGGASDATYELKVTGDIGATGDIVAYVSSDERLKDEITPIENPLDKINQIGGYSFVWNDNQDIYKGKDYGVIAQEIESILPELVENRQNGYKAVKYDRLVSLLIEGIKDLHSEVQELKQKLKD